MPRISIAKIEYHVYNMTNKQRRKHKVHNLKLSRTIGKIARAHSRDMSRRNYMGHYTRGTNFDPTARARNRGFDFSLGENCAQSWVHSYTRYSKEKKLTYHGHKNEYEIASELVKMWMNSPGHCANILSNSYSWIGVGVWVNFKTGKVHATQNFTYSMSSKQVKRFKNFLYRFGFLISGIVFTILMVLFSVVVVVVG